MEIFVLKLSVIGKLSLFSGMWNDALLHHGGLKGFKESYQLLSKATDKFCCSEVDNVVFIS